MSLWPLCRVWNTTTLLFTRHQDTYTGREEEEDMKYSILEKHKTHREQVIKMFQSAFQEKTLKAIKYMLLKKYVLVISLIVLYDNMTKVVYKVIGSVIY